MQGIDALLRAAVESGAVAGVAAVAGQAGGTLYEGAAGLRAAGGSTPMTPDTVGWIASMTKALTSVAALQLVEEGRLALDAPIGTILPELAAPQVLEGFTTAGEPILRPARGAITLRQLLTHTGGFAYETWHADLGRYAKLAGLPRIGTCQRKALALPLVADPGTAWNYGIGIDWAGLVVEAVTGQSLGSVIRDRITGPLGMEDTHFRLGAAQRSRLSAMHVRGADGRLSPIAFEVPQEPEFEMGGGGLYGTAPDYLRFCRMVLNGGTLDGARILAPETVEALGRNQMGDLLVGPMTSVVPGASHHAEFFPGQPKRWSLAFMLNEEAHPEGGRAAGSMAWAGLANSYYWIDPVHDRAGVLLTQSLPFADPQALALFAAFERAVYAAG
ncbi:serine hydrolase domain-containing protein [Belnapia rosea]|uniref:serine hydrolase domain-containing protein n=1 Tax=Belnapia rosea TaxID=938405 RepID=UPI000886A87E|nr:serine hydrolase domain-containing protein [Belnapia rosea]SDB47515.1 CubicO group peptidase, beta-lactamase class C family [Belnapia rosea]